MRRFWGRVDHPIHHLRLKLVNVKKVDRTVSSSEHKNRDSKKSFNAENDDGESESAWRNFKTDLAVLASPVECGHSPCNTNSEENIDSVRASYVADRGISGVISNSCSLWSKCIWRKNQNIWINRFLYQGLKFQEQQMKWQWQRQ